jgi:glycosyltransferase involved in cell wall biosynthesis
MINFEPLVSVVIPTYERTELLKKALESVNKQTYENLEIIIIDDSQTTKPDDFFDGLDKYTIKYIHNEQRNGAPAARNQGISKSSGSFIAFLDDDDTWEPTKIEKQIKLFHNHPQASICITYSHDLRFNHDRINAPPRKVTHEDLIKSFNLSSTSSYLVRN